MRQHLDQSQHIAHSTWSVNASYCYGPNSPFERHIAYLLAYAVSSKGRRSMEWGMDSAACVYILLLPRPFDLEPRS